MTKTFEEKIRSTGTSNVGCLIEIARQLKRIADILENREKEVEK